MSHTEIRPEAPAPRILLVDDTELNRDVFGRVLTSAGYEVDLAEDGAQACEATWAKAYDLVLLDIEMPGMNGFEAAARIRAREGVMSGVRIAALTATKQPDAKEVSFWSGIDAFIAKPIASAPLLERVRALLAEGGPRNDDWKPVWRLGTFETFVAELDEGEGARLLAKFAGRLDAAMAAIIAKDTITDVFLAKLRDVNRQAAILGFEEIAGLCTLYLAAGGEPERCRDPNFIGAIDRARYAIDIYEHMPEPEDEPEAGWFKRMGVNVKTLFRDWLAEPLPRVAA